MAALNWPAIQDFFDTFTINVFKCKLCTQFATTNRDSGIVHIVSEHASVQQDGVIVVFHSNSQDTVVTEDDRLEEMRQKCEHALLKWHEGTQDSCTQSDDVVFADDIAAEEGSVVVHEVEEPSAVREKATEDAGTERKNGKTNEDTGVSSVVAEIEEGDGNGDDDDVSDDLDNDDQYENLKSAPKTDDVQQPSRPESVDRVSQKNKNKQGHKSDQSVPSTKTDTKNTVESCSLRQTRSRSGLRSPDKCKRKVYHDYIQEGVVLKESSVRNNDVPLQCDKCDFTTVSGKSLARHKVTHRTKKARKVKKVVKADTENSACVSGKESESRKDGDDGKQSSLDLPQTCKICSFECKSAKGYKIHMHRHAEQRTSKSIKCNDCGKLFTTRQGMSKHKRDNWCRRGAPKKYKRYTCDVCWKQFVNKAIYEEHLTVHSAIRSYKCDKCDKLFKTVRALKRHGVSHSSESHKCALCNFTTFWQGSLKTHYVSKHNSESRELQQCPHCPFTTRSAWYISKHITLHSEERPFVCEHCGKSFKSDVILRAHLDTHSEKTYPCDQCEYVGNTKAAIYNHRKSHIPKDEMQYKCDQCDWVGKRSTEYQIHLRKHSNMKLFRCGHCGHSYKHKHGLTRHLKEKHIVKAVTTIPEVIFPDLDLEVQEASMTLSSLPVAQFFEISTATEILADANSQE